jgi:hypothetical protein
MRKVLLTMALAAAAAAWNGPAPAEVTFVGDRGGEAVGLGDDSRRVFGLVIGIDRYQRPGLELGGAVNDARTIAAALREVGADVTEITDEIATRDNIKRAWDSIVARAKDGDIVVFTYAGHGAQSPERIMGSEDDGLDEYFVLRDFDPDGPRTYERIVDDDLQEWFSQAPRLKIVLLADSCHSGTMTRGYLDTKLKYRYAKLPPITRDALPPPNPATVDRSTRTGPALDAPPPSGLQSTVQLSNVVSMSAVADKELDPEISIDGVPHGALSWYFAQGLLGAADADRDGQITGTEMKDYLYENVKNKTEGQQHPQFGNTDARPVAKPKHSKPRPLPEARSIAFGFSDNTGDADLENFARASLKQVLWTSAKQARLEWSPRENAIKNEFGDVVYRLVGSAPEGPKTKAFKRVEAPAQPPAESQVQAEGEGGADPRSQGMVAQAQAVVDKFVAVDRLAALVDGSLGVSLHPNDKLHRNGEELTLKVERTRYPYFTLFNLASDGSVNFLYPSLPSDAPALPPGQPYPLALAVAPPFGADHFVAISSSVELKDLHQALKEANGKRPDWERLMGQIRASLKGVDYQLGLHSTFTAD